MFAQIIHWDGPRSAELVAAADRATRERIIPAVTSHPELAPHLVAAYTLRQPDGSEVSVVITDTEEALRLGQQLVMSTELLAGEDHALLPDPDRMETYEVVHAMAQADLSSAGRAMSGASS